MMNIPSDQNIESDKDDSVERARRLISQGELFEATEALEAIERTNSNVVEIFSLLAVIGVHSKNYVMAMDLLKAVEGQPGVSGDVPEILAILYAMAGDLTESLFYAKVAETVQRDERLFTMLGDCVPTFEEIFSRLPENPFRAHSERLIKQGKYNEAVSWIDQHLAVHPRDEDGIATQVLANLLQGSFTQAIEIGRSLRALAPDNAYYASLLARALCDGGNVVEALGVCDEAIALDPKSIEYKCLRVRILAYSSARSPAQTAEALAAVRGEVGSAPRPAPRADGGPLVVGYMVGGVADPADARFVSSVMGLHDRGKVVTICLGDGPVSDEANAPYRNRYDRWIDLGELDPHTMKLVLANERIDILVNASGIHYAKGIPVFGGRPAPVQVGWLGAPLGGVAAGLDAQLVDSNDVDDYALTEGAEAVAMPQGLYAYSAPPMQPDTTLPESAAGTIAFGADVSFAQLNPNVLQTWARILKAVPGSFLCLKDNGFSKPARLERLLEITGNFGVSDRVDLVSADDAEMFYAAVDVVLTPFPHARPYGASTALSMGVPVIALDQPGEACRDVANLLRHTQVDGDMLAGDRDAYVAAAVGWAEDRDKRQAFRNDGWGKMGETQTFNFHEFVASLEDTYVALYAKAQAKG